MPWPRPPPAYQADPAGWQAAHGVQVVTVVEEDTYQAAFEAAPACFAQTNTPQPG